MKWKWIRSFFNTPLLPLCRFVVFQELAGPVGAGEDAVEEGITDAGGTVDNIERGMKIVFGLLQE